MEREPPFVGKSRILLVDGLVDIVDQINDTGEPRWVSIEAPSGWGKTRVAQELYARLAARQSEQYWPRTIIEASDANRLDVASRRKRVYPDPVYFNRAPNALPEFIWLGIACDLRNGRPSETLTEDLDQLSTHGVYLEAAYKALASFRKGRFPSLAQARSALGDVLEEAAGEGLEKAIETFVGVSIPGMGIVVTLGKWGKDKIRERRKENAALASGGALQSLSAEDDLVEDVVNLLTRLARPGLPAVIFIEDLHKTSALVEELLVRLIRNNAAILIITTTWPGEFKERSEVSALLTDTAVQTRILRVQHDQQLPPVFPEGASMGALPAEALGSIIRSYYPDANALTVERLAERYNNPLPLELICTLPKYQKRFTDSALHLPQAEIEKLPRRVEDLYRELWNELPEPAQKALALATLAIPDNNYAWNNSLTQAVIAQCHAFADNDAIARALDQKQFPHGWARVLETCLRCFNEPDQYRIAKTYVDDHFFDPEIDQFLEQLAASIAITDFDSTTPEAEHLAWLAFSLHRTGKLSDELALQAIRLLLVALEDYPRELPTRIELGRYLEELDLERASPDFLTARGLLCIALGSSGQLNEAIAEAQALLVDGVRVLGADNPSVLVARNYMASWLGKSGQIAEALAQCEALRFDQERVLGVDHPDVLATRNNIAHWLAESGQLTEALEQFEALLVDQKRVLGKDHSDVLTTRNNMALWLGESGQIAEALAQCEALLADRERVLGKDHPDVLGTRITITHWLGQSGQFAEALQLCESLLVDLKRVLGADHPHVLTSRNIFAAILGQSGQIAEALAQCEALLADRERVLGKDHPDVLTTRHNMASWLGESGQIAEALEQFEALLADRERVLGADHPDVLTSRNNFAAILGQSRQIAEALAQFEALLADQERVLSADHPDVLWTRDSIAYWLDESEADV